MVKFDLNSDFEKGDVTHLTRNFYSKLFPSLLNCIRETLPINRLLTKLDISGIHLSLKNAKVLANVFSTILIRNF